MPGREVLVCFDRTTDPVQNLRREQDLFARADDGRLPELVRFWVDSECLVRGKARSPKYGWYRERLARDLGIQVIQRETGGGVVYHDEGNLNWSFFLRSSGAFLSPTAAFGLASKHMVRALRGIRVPAQFSPPNRIDVSNRKVSGMAAKSTKRTLLVHGTLLLNSDLEKLNLLCIPPAGCPKVANLSEWIKDIDATKVLSALVGVLQDSGFRTNMSDISDAKYSTIQIR